MMAAEVLKVKERPQSDGRSPQRINTVVVGAGQAGLATGYFLQQKGIDFLILDGAERIGESWRKRWDSLRLFSPARYNELPGKPYPAEPYYYPTKDEHAAYLEAYAETFDLPIYLNTRVERVTRAADGYLVFTAGKTYEAGHVISAMSSFQIPHIPPFAPDLDPAIKQLHASAYRRPGQLRSGDALIVGAGNSGAEIALDIAGDRRTWLSGRHPGQEPFSVQSKTTDRFLVPLVLDLLFSRLLTVDIALGRKVRADILGHGSPLVRINRSDIDAAGIKRVPRVAGVQDGLPRLDDGRVLEVENVIWSTGFRPNFSWIDLPIFGGEDDPLEPVHRRGVVPNMPGFYFVGLFFQYSAASAIVFGMVRDAKYVVDHLVQNLVQKKSGAPAVSAVLKA